jgi:putative hydrolase of the HAD superfamily
MIRAIIFDFGKVVGFFDHRLVTSRLAPHGDLPAAELHAFIFDGLLEDDYETGRISSTEFLGQIRDKARLRCSEDVLIASYADIFWPNPDVCNLLPHLRGKYRLLLGSNTSELHSRHFRRQFAEALGHFDALVLSHEIGARKPAAAFFERCVSLAGCAPRECVFIDDLPANVAGAQAYGLHGIVYTSIDDLAKRLANLHICLPPPFVDGVAADAHRAVTPKVSDP